MKKCLFFTLCACLLFACSDNNEWTDIESTEFTRAAVQPSWFAKTKVHPLENLQQMQTLWRSHKRCCDADFGVTKSNREFYKSCFVAIYSKPDDPDLTPYCLWLMDVALDYEQGTKLSRYLLKNFPDYQRRIDNCANCSTGDLIARVTRDVALFEFNREQLHDKALNRLDDLLINRSNEITFWVLGEIFESMAEMLITVDASAAQIDTLADRVEALTLIWPDEPNQAWRLKNVNQAMLALYRQYGMEAR